MSWGRVVLLGRKKYPSASMSGEVLQVLEKPTVAATIKARHIWDIAQAQTPSDSTDFGLPFRSDIGLKDLGQSIPLTFIIELVGSDDDYYVRLLGSDIIDMIGTDMTGSRLSDHPEAKWRTTCFDWVRAHKKPRIRRALLGVDDALTKVESIILPVCDNNGQFNQMMCVVAPLIDTPNNS